jgi:parallel beta-helix repeat protein
MVSNRVEARLQGTTNAQVLNNTYTNNNGNGLWGDCGDTGTVFSGNTITGSRLSGIRYEISHNATITNNTLIKNDQYQSSGACNRAREIWVYASDNTSVSGNTVTSNCAGIAINQDTRNAVVNDSVTDNITTYSGSIVLPNSIGATDSLTPMTMFNTASGNYFDYNTYHFSSQALLKLKNWTWNSKGSLTLSWLDWQAVGQDLHGAAD